MNKKDISSLKHENFGFTSDEIDIPNDVIQDSIKKDIIYKPYELKSEPLSAYYKNLFEHWDTKAKVRYRHHNRVRANKKKAVIYNIYKENNINIYKQKNNNGVNYYIKDNIILDKKTMKKQSNKKIRQYNKSLINGSMYKKIYPVNSNIKYVDKYYYQIFY